MKLTHLLSAIAIWIRKMASRMRLRGEFVNSDTRKKEDLPKTARIGLELVTGDERAVRSARCLQALHLEASEAMMVVVALPDGEVKLTGSAPWVAASNAPKTPQRLAG